MTKPATPHLYSRSARPVTRAGVYDLYWVFASQRHAAFERRLSGAARPWSDDPILETYKFCNVFRAADRVSQYMIREVAGGGEAETVEDRIFGIVAFRTFSNERTWDGVRRYLGGRPRLAHLDDGSFEAALDAVRSENGGLYTGAFILCATKAFGFDEKHRNHVGLFKHMFLESDAANRLLAANSLAAVVSILESFPLMGPFMAYQTAIDLCYSDLFPFSENDYTQAGPGALRGLKKAFSDLGDFSPAEAIRWMVDQQADEFDRLQLPFGGLFGRPLHAIDCQGLFCELDKYCREAVPELKSARSRIKARFSPSAEALPLVFPPKWQLATGHKIPAFKAPPEDGMLFDLPDGPRTPGRRMSRRTSTAETGEQRLLL